MAGVFSVVVGMTVAGKLNQISADKKDSTPTAATKVSAPYYTSDDKKEGSSIDETCSKGTLVAINNYPDSTTLKKISAEGDKGINQTWLDKMGEQSWKCSHVCITGFDEGDYRSEGNKEKVKRALEGATAKINDQKDTKIQVLTSSEILELMKKNPTGMKAVVNIDSLKSRCEGPNSTNYSTVNTTLGETTILKRNETNTVNISSSGFGTSSPAGIGDANSVNTSANSSDDSTPNVIDDTGLGEGGATTTSSTAPQSYTNFKKCYGDIGKLLVNNGYNTKEKADKFLTSNGLINDTVSLYGDYFSPLSKLTKWTKTNEAKASKALETCNDVWKKISSAIGKKEVNDLNREIEVKIHGKLYYSDSAPSKRGIICVSLIPPPSFTGVTIGENFNRCTTAKDGSFSTGYKIKYSEYLAYRSILIYAVDTGGLKSAKSAIYNYDFINTEAGYNNYELNFIDNPIVLSNKVYDYDHSNARFSPKPYRLTATKLRAMAKESTGVDCLRGIK